MIRITRRSRIKYAVLPALLVSFSLSNWLALFCSVARARSSQINSPWGLILWALCRIASRIGAEKLWSLACSVAQPGCDWRHSSSFQHDGPSQYPLPCLASLLLLCKLFPLHHPKFQKHGCYSFNSSETASSTSSSFVSYISKYFTSIWVNSELDFYSDATVWTRSSTLSRTDLINASKMDFIRNYWAAIICFSVESETILLSEAHSISTSDFPLWEFVQPFDFPILLAEDKSAVAKPA